MDQPAGHPTAENSGNPKNQTRPASIPGKGNDLGSGSLNVVTTDYHSRPNDPNPNAAKGSGVVPDPERINRGYTYPGRDFTPPLAKPSATRQRLGNRNAGPKSGQGT